MQLLERSGLLLMLLICSCGGRSRPAGDTMTDTGQPDSARLSDAALARCIVAARLDSCCSTAVAVSASEMAADPCLVPYAARGVQTPACPPLDPAVCSAVDCVDQPPLSRLATRGPDGQCTFASECASAADCVPALNIRDCCACLRSYPRSLTAADPCLTELGADDDLCQERCTGMADCEACPPPPDVTCAASDEATDPQLKVCQESAPCSCDGGCSEEQRCLQSQGGGLTPNGVHCEEPFGLAQCRPRCGPDQPGCPDYRPHCTELTYTSGCCSDALIRESVCCANTDATGVDDCW